MSCGAHASTRPASNFPSGVPQKFLDSHNKRFIIERVVRPPGVATDVLIQVRRQATRGSDRADQQGRCDLQGAECRRGCGAPPDIQELYGEVIRMPNERLEVLAPANPPSCPPADVAAPAAAAACSTTVVKHVFDVADLATDLSRVPTAKDVAKAAKATKRAANRRKAAAKAVFGILIDNDENYDASKTRPEDMVDNLSARKLFKSLFDPDAEMQEELLKVFVRVVNEVYIKTA